MEADEGPEQEPSAPVEETSASPRSGADKARRTLQVEAEEARRRVLGTRTRSAARAPAPSDEDAVPVDAEHDEGMRRLLEELEYETGRLREQADDLRAEAERAATKLREQAEHAAELLVVRAAEDAQREDVNLQEIDRLGDAISRAVGGATASVDQLTRRLTGSADDVARAAGAL